MISLNAAGAPTPIGDPLETALAQEATPAPLPNPELLQQEQDEAKQARMRELTEEDIESSEYLRSQGIKPGDMFDPEERSITRVESVQPRGRLVTREDVLNSATLREKGVEEGDFLVPQEDGSLKHVKSGDNDWFSNFEYAYSEATTFSENWGNYLDSLVPLPRLGVSREEYYGEDWRNLTPEERRDRGIAYRERQLAEMREDFEPTSNITGSIVGSVDPAWLLGTTVAGAGLVGGAFELGDQLANNEELDPVAVGGYALAGAVTAGIANKAVQALKGRGKNKVELESPTSSKVAQELQDAVNAKLAQGTTVSKAFKEAQEETGISLKDLDVKPRITSSAETGTAMKISIDAEQSAAKAADTAIATDSAFARTVSKPVDKYLGALSTRIKNISEDVFAGLRKFEARSHINTAKKLNTVQPWARAIKGLPEAVRSGVNQNLLNGNYKAVESILRQYAPEVADTTKEVQALLKQTYKDLKSAGFDLEEIEDYFPRIVKDIDTFITGTGGTVKSRVNFALEQFAKAKGVPVKSLSPEIQAEVADRVANNYIFKAGGKGGSGRWVKSRKVDNVTSDLVAFYADPVESLSTYLRTTTNAIERAKFFGKAHNTTDGMFDGDTSIGQMVLETSKKQGLSKDQEGELFDMLQARFVGGEKNMGTVSGWIRDTGYAGTIANPVSALTQLGDLAVSGALYGLRNTLVGLFGPKNHKIVDLGLESAAQEFVNPSKSAKALDALFTVSGFKLIDRLGKQTTIASAIRKYSQMAKTPKGVEELRREWGAMFDDEFDNLLVDLASGKRTDNTDLLAFNVLSDMQPITKSELPEVALSSPMARLAYMLKSFTLKQWDIVRRNVIQEFDRNPVKAVKNMTLLLGYLGVANAGTSVLKDFALGREVRAEDLPMRAVWAMLGVYGFNQYMFERNLSRGDVKGAVVNLVVPALPILDVAGGAIKEGIDSFKDEESWKESLLDQSNAKSWTRSIPVIGPLYYAWFGGGREAYNERLDKD